MRRLGGEGRCACRSLACVLCVGGLAEVGAEGNEKEGEGGKGKWEEEGKNNARNLGTTPPGHVLSDANGDIFEAI